MKIAYVTTYDSSDVHAWSGLGSYILRSLQDVGIQTESIGNLREGNIWALQSRLKKIYYKLQSRQYLRDRETGLLKYYAAQVTKRIAPLHPDIVFSAGTIPIAYLQTEQPIVFWTGSTFAGMINFYPEFTNLCSETIQNGNKMEQLALSRCRLAIYSSEWAANSAIHNYDVDPAKVKVVPYGANMNNDRDLNEIDKIIDKKDFDTCKLLFVGVDWHRKGGNKALTVAELLNKRGLRTELHIVGCTPPFSPPPFVKNHGFISKKTEEGRKHLEQLFSDSHFLILPSQAECFGVVFAEASSFGLPSLATKVGGIPTAIQDGKNGWTFHIDETPEKYCDYIERFMISKDDYRGLALTCFQEYSERLNWHSVGTKVYDLMQEFCG
ncbi:MAG: glycosyltransferase family 4 protein [Microcystis sp.]|jgi:glycosyltransferase involved in cell wall biosynthesis|uniref:glycosyltransferase family 4 protein n=1 Tax=Microcystis sp. TaxID=1127 RepID=UPI0022BA9FBA|nr:glycosyltransferase family 4 protein [Microcystis sp. LE17-20D]MCZ8068258.1 glycosyltransferase family 4 protein [Microcystis sp. LE17-20D]MCZ8163059.1 glycosyltransferase family 4 protein [Microcystis sp. LE19-196.1B]MCZ8274296.1 glycosyltransferase family 4 protein [Microcystis sp. LE19-4.1E]